MKEKNEQDTLTKRRELKDIRTFHCVLLLKNCMLFGVALSSKTQYVTLFLMYAIWTEYRKIFFERMWSRKKRRRLCTHTHIRGTYRSLCNTFDLKESIVSQLLSGWLCFFFLLVEWKSLRHLSMQREISIIDLNLKHISNTNILRITCEKARVPYCYFDTNLNYIQSNVKLKCYRFSLRFFIFSNATVSECLFNYKRNSK